MVMEQNLPEKTGKSLQQWKALLNKQGFAKHGEMMHFLKSEHGVSHGFANFIVLKYREADAASAAPEDLVAKQYAKKPDLLPIYEALKKMILALGDDIHVSPKKAAVSFRCKRQFALVQPSTKTRIDLGLKLDNTLPQGRLEPSGPFGTMCSHRVQLTSVEQVDNELMRLLKEAYQQAH